MSAVRPMTIGVLGGMGPEATNRLCHLITALTPAKKDQDHIPVIAYNNSAIPERVDSILNGGPSALPELVRTAKVLEQAGADFLLMPCNAAHFFLDEIQGSVGIPVINMVAETVNHVVRHHGQVRKAGLLATTATVKTSLYARPFGECGIDVITPAHEVQQRQVMAAIFGPRGIKRGFKSGPRAMLIEAGLELMGSGADVIIAGCTEISVVFTGKLPFAVVDPLAVVAAVAVERARAGAAVERVFV